MFHLYHIIAHWLAVQTGTYIAPGQYSDHYNFWSGFGSDISEFVLLAGAFTIYKHHNCAVPRCPRLAHKKYEIKETKQYVCRKHHTAHWHNILIKQYKQDYPEQHKLINKGKK